MQTQDLFTGPTHRAHGVPVCLRQSLFGARLIRMAPVCYRFQAARASTEAPPATSPVCHANTSCGQSVGQSVIAAPIHLSAACWLPSGWVFVLLSVLLARNYTNEHVPDTSSAHGTRNMPESSGPISLTGERQVSAPERRRMSATLASQAFRSYELSDDRLDCVCRF
jgi:hypothetical protein